MNLEQYAEVLKRLGMDVELADGHHIPGAYMLWHKIPTGYKSLWISRTVFAWLWRRRGFEILSVENAPEAQAVVMGIDRDISFQKVVEATLLVRSGVPFYATNLDRTFPTPRGEIPGSGAWISVITTATGVQPIIAGKPFPFLMELSLEKLGTRKEETLVVGDRLETDIAAGQAVGCSTALVLSGVSTREQAEEWTPKPDIIAEDLAALIQ
jgi:ribonucleotide monophosphatase NagD (HAD superfamily)